MLCMFVPCMRQHGCRSLLDPGLVVPPPPPLYKKTVLGPFAHDYKKTLRPPAQNGKLLQMCSAQWIRRLSDGPRDATPSPAGAAPGPFWEGYKVPYINRDIRLDHIADP